MANELDSLNYCIVICIVCGDYDESWEMINDFVCRHCEAKIKKETDETTKKRLPL